ncbi:hypothetical protein ACIQF6_18185 [Kitasatospora sp. NPDC092948]|uniref:hypothetical protein n=1 Tax=Kitasatospora sp. NPDC092948 TaxID=3364088 RepID=UPI00382A4787
MGVLFGYFAAADDDDALGAIVRDDDEPFGAGYDGTVVKGIDPVVVLGPAEELVTGRSGAAVRADPRCGALVGMDEDGEAVVLSLSDAFRDALARQDDAALGEVAERWAAVDGVFDGPADPDELAEFLRELAGIAARAVARCARLYCWVCP